MVTDKLHQFCAEANGEIVNDELAERLMRDSFSVFSRSPLSDSLYKEPFLTVNHAGVFWHKCETEGALLNSLEDLIKFFSKRANQEKYSLEDESGWGCTLNELISGEHRD